jgi:hypothetical protein
MVYGLGEKVCEKQAEAWHDAWLTEERPQQNLLLVRSGDFPMSHS